MRTNFEDLLRDKVHSLDNSIPPEVQWQPEDSWSRISRILGDGGTRVYLHYLVAASVACLLYLSGSLSVINLENIVPFPQPKVKVDPAQNFQVVTTSLDRKTPLQVNGQETGHSNGFLTQVHPPRVEQPNIGSQSLAREMPSRLVQDHSTFKSQINPQPYPGFEPQVKFSILGGAGYAGNRFGPAVTVKAAYLYPGKGKYNSLGLSISSIHLFEKEESGKTSLKSNLFLNAEWGVMGKKKLDLGMGYMVLSKSDIFKDHTVHFYGRFPIGKLLKVSPEVILTNNFKKVIPGISLLIG